VAEAIGAAIGRTTAPGAQAALLAHGSIAWVRCWGLSGAGGPEVRPVTLFQAASISKTVTAWCVLALVEEGRLELDAPIGRYVDRWRPGPSPHAADGLTLGRLMSHTAGLSVPFYPGEDPGRRRLPPEDALFAPEGERLSIVAAPGTEFRYSGGGWALLQCAVEAATGRPFARAMRERVLAPLGMSSSFRWSRAVAAAVAEGHDASGRRLPNFRYRAAAAAGLYAGAGDLARFLLAHVPGPDGEPAGRGVISPASVELATMAVAETGRADGLWAGYGLGYEVEALGGGARLVGHSGINRGWRARMGLRLPEGDGLAVLVNGDGGDAVVAAAFAAWARAAWGRVPAGW
jgi:D-alanyl-D-alanine carboxypeptidase